MLNILTGAVRGLPGPSEKLKEPHERFHSGGECNNTCVPGSKLYSSVSVEEVALTDRAKEESTKLYIEKSIVVA